MHEGRGWKVKPKATQDGAIGILNCFQEVTPEVIQTLESHQGIRLEDEEKLLKRLLGTASSVFTLQVMETEAACFGTPTLHSRSASVEFSVLSYEVCALGVSIRSWGSSLDDSSLDNKIWKQPLHPFYLCILAFSTSTGTSNDRSAFVGVIGGGGWWWLKDSCADDRRLSKSLKQPPHPFCRCILAFITGTVWPLPQVLLVLVTDHQHLLVLLAAVVGGGLRIAVLMIEDCPRV
ncbi:hypothetical protein QE152_g11265 [Popillia japonica]|uniref:Uncharacterized protein n=1 Tax=Popillia japonica TaxID=7064 RepID=A0AAW1LSB6_POPJA